MTYPKAILRKCGVSPFPNVVQEWFASGKPSGGGVSGLGVSPHIRWVQIDKSRGWGVQDEMSNTLHKFCTTKIPIIFPSYIKVEVRSENLNKMRNKGIYFKGEQRTYLNEQQPYIPKNAHITGS